jgi:Na+/melibiose symporter-like transporter
MFIGLTAGPFVSGFLPRDASLVSAALLNVGAALYVAFIMPETLGRQQHLQEQREALAQGSGEEHAADPEKQKLIGSGGQKSYGADSDNQHNKDNKTAPIAAAEPKKKKKRGVWMAYHFLTQNRLFMLIGLITLVSQLAVFGVGQVYFLYLNEEAGFARADTIRAALIGGVETTFVMLFGMPWLSQHVNESVLMLIGLTCYFIYAMGLALAASSKLIVFGIIIFWSLSGLTFPSTCALLSAHTPHEQTGLAQGALSAMRCCASGLGPALFAVFFSKMVSLKREVMGPQPVHFVEDKATLSFLGLFDVHYAALPFVLGAVFIAASLALTLYIPSNIIHAPSTKHAQVEPEPDQHEHQHELLEEQDEAEEEEGDEECPARSKDKKEVVEV